VASGKAKGAPPRTPGWGISGTTATFEHAVPHRRDAGHGALRGISVRRAGVCGIEHCSLTLSGFLALSRALSRTRERVVETCLQRREILDHAVVRMDLGPADGRRDSPALS
jgi:hypothetical protein